MYLKRMDKTNLIRLRCTKKRVRCDQRINGDPASYILAVVFFTLHHVSLRHHISFRFLLLSKFTIPEILAILGPLIRNSADND